MRRPCTDYEKEFIQNNSSNIIAGTLEVKDNKPSRNFDNIFFPLVFISAPFLVKYDANKVELILVAICLMIISYVISQVSLKIIVLNREKKRIIKSNNLSINGATVVLIDSKDSYVHICEDDFKDKQGRPYKIILPINNVRLKVEERLISIMTSEGEYFLMRTNEETQKSISYYDWFDVKKAIEENNWSPYLLPHPNVLNLDRDMRKISNEEKNKFKEQYYAESKLNIWTHYFCLVLISFVVTYVIGYFVYYFPLMERYFEQSFIVASIIAFIISVILIINARIKLSKKLDEVSYVQNVMVSRWSSHKVGRHYVPILMVYMCQGNKLVERGYEELGLKKGLGYGRILNMYTDGVKYYFM